MWKMSSSVKQERHDEAEINEMAAKLIEAQKAKMPIAGRSGTGSAGRSPNPGSILSYLTKTNGKGKLEPTGDSCSSPIERPNPVLDDRSQKGQFGWSTLGKVHIPYIYRGEDKYCAVRMVEMKVLNKYLTFLHQDIYNCTCIRSYYITEAEGRLLNEINFIHCDSMFGRDQFTGRDLIVRLSDAVEFYNFLDACYSKLLNGSSNPLDRCGFIRINKESVVPYTIYNSDKFVPLFYFEGETDNLKLRANKLEGWDLSYLKFCCKVQGIRNELFAHDSCSVISLNDIKNYFPPGTTFEDYWPQKMVDTQFLITNKTASQTQVGQWTRQPVGPPINTHPPPSPKPATQAKAAANITQLHNVQSMYSNYNLGVAQTPYQPRTAASAVRTNYGSVTTSARQSRPAYNYAALAPGPTPPPLVRSVGYPGYLKEEWPGSAYTNSQSTAANYMMMGDNYRHQSLHKYPPPLIPVRHLNGGMRYDTYSSEVVDLSANNHQLINQQPAHQQQQPRSQASSTQDDRTNGRMNSLRKMVQIPDTPTSGSHIPYKMQKAVIEGKMINAINMKPYVYTDLLVTLNDLVNCFFNNVPIHSCQQVLQVLGIDLYKGNTSQMQVLAENGKIQGVNDTCPLVQVRNVIEFMPQVKYMLSGIEMASKRS
ncbi:PREDICTED: uncharacterized protein LOC108567069 isoform X2 [Nicrophorus vespilloides]|uniref:Uncharacterized protein LOC108567069 isoform X2 n=1 Tax=Nicrophorus vespilloides TaxID=110193 RepID=A0ABM1N7H1_NICVS|nr:PREDICTED: uncharacterized protein LOC108567069 isoform X2 [Nicrophorus vespilloides]